MLAEWLYNSGIKQILLFLFLWWVIINDDQKIYFDHGTVGLDSLYSTPQRRVNKILDLKSKNYKYLVFDGNFFNIKS